MVQIFAFANGFCKGKYSKKDQIFKELKALETSLLASLDSSRKKELLDKSVNILFAVVEKEKVSFYERDIKELKKIEVQSLIIKESWIIPDFLIKIWGSLKGDESRKLFLRTFYPYFPEENKKLGKALIRSYSNHKN